MADDKNPAAAPTRVGEQFRNTAPIGSTQNPFGASNADRDNTGDMGAKTGSKAKPETDKPGRVTPGKDKADAAEAARKPHKQAKKDADGNVAKEGKQGDEVALNVQAPPDPYNKQDPKPFARVSARHDTAAEMYPQDNAAEAGDLSVEQRVGRGTGSRDYNADQPQPVAAGSGALAVWKEHFGELPHGNKLFAKDGNPDNTAPANLESLNVREMKRRGIIDGDGKVVK